MTEEFDVTLDVEDIFNAVIKKNPNLTAEQRVQVWGLIEKAIDGMIQESERVTCLNV